MNKYSLTRKSEKVVLVGRDNVEVECELREMSAADRDAYLTRLSSRLSTDAAGTATGVRDFQGLQADLISHCLFRGDTQVPKDEVQAWPATVVTGIYKQAQAMNRLDKEEGDASPNA